MARARLESWVVSDAFWERVNADSAAAYDGKGKRQTGGGCKPDHRLVFEAIVYA
jgi:hypothetical protein